MKLKKAWIYDIGDGIEIIDFDGDNHPAAILFRKWAKNLPRKRTFLLTSSKHLN